jgi:hypothetical protein
MKTYRGVEVQLHHQYNPKTSVVIVTSCTGLVLTVATKNRDSPTFRRNMSPPSSGSKSSKKPAELGGKLISSLQNTQFCNSENHTLRGEVGGSLFLCIPSGLSNGPTVIYLYPWLPPVLREGADKSLAFPTCSTTKIIFLGWVKEVRTTQS